MTRARGRPGGLGGPCQLFCGEIARVTISNLAIDEGCLSRIRQIAKDAGVHFDETLVGHSPNERLIRRDARTKPSRGMRLRKPRPARGLLGKKRVCASCRRRLEVKPGLPPRICPHCGGAARKAGT